MVELIMMPAPAFESGAASGSPSQNSVDQMKIRPSKAARASHPAQAQEEASEEQRTAKHVCERQGEDLLELLTAEPSKPPSASNVLGDGDIEHGEIPIGLSRELAEELGLLPATVYSPAK